MHYHQMIAYVIGQWSKNNLLSSVVLRKARKQLSWKCTVLQTIISNFVRHGRKVRNSHSKPQWVLKPFFNNKLILWCRLLPNSCQNYLILKQTYSIKKFLIISKNKLLSALNCPFPFSHNHPWPITPRTDIGVIGLAVMGRNLVLNLVDNGFRVSVYNRTTPQERLLQGNSF